MRPAQVDVRWDFMTLKDRPWTTPVHFAGNAVNRPTALPDGALLGVDALQMVQQLVTRTSSPNAMTVHPRPPGPPQGFGTCRIEHTAVASPCHPGRGATALAIAQLGTSSLSLSLAKGR